MIFVDDKINVAHFFQEAASLNCAWYVTRNKSY